MDLMNLLLNMVVPPFTLLSFMLFLPPWKFFKLCMGVFRCFFSEDVSTKVVLITGASSGIGEHLAYEYASRGACLVLCARRESRLREVAEICLRIGSPDVMTMRADVGHIDDCRRVVEQAIAHFGRLDHLVNNAGISQVSKLEDAEDVTSLRSVTDINFWGAVYMTRFAIPHLRNTGGKIIVISSCASWLPLPRMSIYNASKSAISQFFETLRVELGSDIKITLVTPGYIESEMTQGKFLTDKGETVVDLDVRDMQVNIIPLVKVDKCARAIVNAALCGERYVTVPGWCEMTYFWKMFWPEAIEWANRLLFLTKIGTNSQRDYLGKRIREYISGAQRMLYPSSIQTSEAKMD